MAFAENAFSLNGFQIDIRSGGTGGASGSGVTGFDRDAFADVYLRARNASKPVREAPKVVQDAIKEVAQQSIIEPKRKSERNYELESRIKAAGIRLQLAQLKMLDTLEKEYFKAEADAELQQRLRRKRDDEAIMLLTM